MSNLRDQAVRVELTISRHVVARLAGVSLPTLDKYELDPLAVAHPRKRERLGKVYAKLREVLGRDYLEDEPSPQAA